MNAFLVLGMLVSVWTSCELIAQLRVCAEIGFRRGTRSRPNRIDCFESQKAPAAGHAVGTAGKWNDSGVQTVQAPLLGEHWACLGHCDPKHGL